MLNERAPSQSSATCTRHFFCLVHIKVSMKIKSVMCVSFLPFSKGNSHSKAAKELLNSQSGFHPKGPSMDVKNDCNGRNATRSFSQRGGVHSKPAKKLLNTVQETTTKRHGPPK